MSFGQSARRVQWQLCSVTNTDVSQEDMLNFNALWPEVQRDLASTDFGPDFNQYYARLVDYNIHGGRSERFKNLLVATRILAPDSLTPERLLELQRLGWCMELMEATYNIADDMADRSETRRSKKCWYLLPDVDFNTAIDTILMENGVYYLLTKYFSDKPYYYDLVESFLVAGQINPMGQTLDRLVTNKIDKFSKQLWTTIANYKAAHFFVFFPVCLAMYLAGIKDPEMHRKTEDLLVEIGNYWQLLNDYEDCYGDPKKTGKVGTDIIIGKMTWLVLEALERGSPSQRQTIKECYGCNDPQKVEAVLNVYEELNLSDTFWTIRENNYKLMKSRIQQLPPEYNQDLFTKILDKTYYYT